MKKFTKVMTYILSAVMLLVCAGCGGNAGGRNAALELPEGEIAYPKTLSVFVGGGYLVDNMKDYNEVLAFQLLEEKTGTHLEWETSIASGDGERFNLMIASGNYPDIIIGNWSTIGIEEYIEDGVIFDMSPYVKDVMPNFTKFTNEHPDFARAYVHDGGKVFYTPYIRKDIKLNIFTGPVIRTDWLKKLNLEVPTNSEELYNVLKAFKTQDPNGNGKADEVPMTAVYNSTALSLDPLLHMFGTTNNFYVEDGKVKFGIMEDGFEEGLKYTAKLYSEGLIDPDYLVQERTASRSKITNNISGFAFEYQPSAVMSAMKEKDPAFKWEGIPVLKNQEGEKSSLMSAYANSVYQPAAAAISTGCEEPFGAMKWLDFIYSDEGHMIMNFGREGDTYEMVDGTPVISDKLKNDPQGRSASVMWQRSFATYNSYFPATQDWISYGTYLEDEGKVAIETWADGVVTDRILPSLIFGAEDSERIKELFTPIETYVDECVDKIIIGQEKIENLPKIREEIKNRGIDEVLKIYQKAYDEYYSKDIEIK